MTLSGSATASEPARAVLNVDYNLDRTRPAIAAQNHLDLYLPAQSGSARSLRPVVVWVHGGALMVGDKANRMPNKVRLFNDLGYIVASLNYRLSPEISPQDTSQAFAPGRVRAPDHIADVAEAIGWISRNIARHGGDPDRLVLIGHSAGAHLVSLAATNPSWLAGRGVSGDQILGVVSLDTDTWNVRAEADPNAVGVSASRRIMPWHTFGTPEEEAADPRWDSVSPLLHADPSDPPFLLVTQLGRPARLASNSGMATALGQDPATSVVGVPLDHEGINTALGSPTDPTVGTARVSQFTRAVVSAARPAGVRIVRRPPRRVVQVKRNARRRVAFAFRGTGRTAGFQCRIDRQPYRRCGSPRSYRLRPGFHTFRVRPLFPSGRPGDERKVTFRIVTRRTPGRGR